MAKVFNMTGKAFWVKVLGEPTENYQETGNEWTMDVQPNEKGIALLKRVGLAEKIRNKDDDREDFITFRRNELKKDGSENNKIEVVDADGNPWPEDKAIGNGSTVKVRFSVFEMPAKGKFKAIIKPVIYKVTVVDLVEYKKAERTAAKPAAKKAKNSANEEDWQAAPADESQDEE
jgi:hypothetical protein